MKYLVIDIATTAQPDIEDAPYLGWASKKGSSTPEEAYSKAGLHPEFGMIAALSACEVMLDRDKCNVEMVFSETASTIDEEESMLSSFRRLLDEENLVLIAHNAKEYVIPYITKRYLANGLVIPEYLRWCIRSDFRDGAYMDLMKELACGSSSMMSLRSAAWMLGVEDERAGVQSPKYYELAKAFRYDEVKRLSMQNCEVAAGVFVECVLGGLIKIGG